ncbi:hypothetical protein STANM309S_01198 [Streptomyces tanashiensis]
MSTPRRSPKRPAIRTASAPPGRPVDRPADDEIWPRVTRELADDLAVDALARDRAGKAPFDEVARLQEAGLPALLTAPGPTRRGADWRAACAVVREISAADSSVGELLAHHYALSWSSRFFGPGHDTGDTRSHGLSLDVCTAEERWLLAGGVEPPRGESGPGLRHPRRRPRRRLDPRWAAQLRLRRDGRRPARRRRTARRHRRPARRPRGPGSPGRVHGRGYRTGSVSAWPGPGPSPSTTSRWSPGT